MKFCSILKTLKYAPFRHPHQNHRREAAGVLRAIPVRRQAQGHRLQELKGTVRAQAPGILLLPVHYKWDYTSPDKHIGSCSTQLEINKNVATEEDYRRI